MCTTLQGFKTLGEFVSIILVELTLHDDLSEEIIFAEKPVLSRKKEHKFCKCRKKAC
jgi:hypothetical protein